MSRIIRITLVLAVLAVVLTAGAVVAWQVLSRQRSVYTDGRAIREPASIAQVRDVLWSPAEALPDVINSALDESEPCISADGSMLLFVRAWPDAPGDIWFSIRAGSGEGSWSEPQPLNGINSSADERSPALSFDARSLYFCSNREGGEGGFDIWLSRREGDVWTAPVNLGPRVNSARDDVDVATGLDDAAIYFASNRPARLGAAAAGDSADGPGNGEAGEQVVVDDESFNLFVTRRGDDREFGASVTIDAINTAAHERSPALSPAGDFLYVASDRADGQGGFDLYRSRLVDGVVTEPVTLGPTINSNQDDLDPAVAMEGFALYFSMADDAPADVGAVQDEPAALDEASNGSDLFVAISREVYRDREASWLNLTSLARIMWPMLWGLLAAAMILGLLSLLRSSYARHIGLLARCVIASLLVHCMLMLGFMVWQVSSGIAGIVRDGGLTRVALHTGSSNSDLEGQLRGQFVDSRFTAGAGESARGDVEGQATATAPETYQIAAGTSQVAGDQSRFEAATATASAADAAAPGSSTATPLDGASTTFELAAASTDIAQPQLGPQASSGESSGHGEPAAPGPAPRLAATASTGSGRGIATSEVAAPSSGLPARAVSQSAAASGDAAEASAPSRTDAPQPTRGSPVASGTAQLDLQTPAAPAARSGDGSAEHEPAAAIAGQLQATGAARAAPGAGASSASATAPSASRASAAPLADIPLGERLTSGSSNQARDSQPTSASPVGSPPTGDDAVETAGIVADFGVPSDTASSIAATGATGAEAHDAAPSLVASGDAPRGRESPGGSSALPGIAQASTISAGADAPSIDGALVSSQPLAATGTASARESSPSPRAGSLDSSTGVADGLDLDAVAIGGVSLPSQGTDSRQSSPTESALAGTTHGPGQATRQSAAAVASSGSGGSSASGSSIGSVELDAPSSMPGGGGTGGSSAAAPRAIDAPSGKSGGAPSGDIDALPTTVVDVPVALAGAGQPGQPGGGSEGVANAGFAAGTATSGAASYDVPVAPPAAAAVSNIGGGSGSGSGSDRIDTDEAGSASRAHVTGTDATTVQIASVTEGAPLPMLGEPEFASHDLDVPLPREIDQPYSQRAPETREELVEKMGGSKETERAVELSLAWLAAHQHPDGRWDADGFDRHCGKCGGEAAFDADVATTGLALLCFLAADHSHLKHGPYRDNVNRGIAWLKSVQREHGDLRRTETMYSHAIATIALAEAYGMTRDESLRTPVEAAVDYMIKARNKQIGGWRYEPGQAGDTSVFGWVVMGFTSAKRAGIPIPEEVFDASREWLDVVSTKRDRGLYAYQPGQKHTPAMTAEGLFSQQLLGRKRHETRMIQAASFLSDNLPNWSADANSYYWYYGTLAMYQHQGEAWERWNKAMTREILEHQITSGPAAGSWDPTDRWSLIGGRIYQTALCTLSLEVYYRYLPLYSRLVE
jgi:hypothetical protein